MDFSYRCSALQHLDIRLFILLPGLIDDVLTGFIRTYPSAPEGAAVPTYEALSYVWGSLSEPTNIEILWHDEVEVFVPNSPGDETNGLPFRNVQVSSESGNGPNLASAVRHVRREGQHRVLGRDSICVIQQDVAAEEKQLMFPSKKVQTGAFRQRPGHNLTAREVREDEIAQPAEKHKLKPDDSKAEVETNGNFTGAPLQSSRRRKLTQEEYHGERFVNVSSNFTVVNIQDGEEDRHHDQGRI